MSSATGAARSHLLRSLLRWESGRRRSIFFTLPFPSPCNKSTLTLMHLAFVLDLSLVSRAVSCYFNLGRAMHAGAHGSCACAVDDRDARTPRVAPSDEF